MLRPCPVEEDGHPRERLGKLHDVEWHAFLRLMRRGCYREVHLKQNRIWIHEQFPAGQYLRRDLLLRAVGLAKEAGTAKLYSPCRSWLPWKLFLMDCTAPPSRNFRARPFFFPSLPKRRSLALPKPYCELLLYKVVEAFIVYDHLPSPC